MSYHHGDLRRALLRAAGEAITDQGIAGLSMRDLARRAGVSHAAPTHHFGDKAGLLTAFATEGFEELAKALAGNTLLEMGAAYVRFAVGHRAHFEVMFRPDLYHADDPGLLAARRRSADALYSGVVEMPGGIRSPGSSEVRTAGLAAWSLAHGFATLWLAGAFPGADADPAETARVVLAELNRAADR